MPYQPMDTAPRDRDILLRLKDGDTAVGRYCEGSFGGPMDPADAKDGCRWVATQWSPYADYAPPLYPVGWMDIPD